MSSARESIIDNIVEHAETAYEAAKEAYYIILELENKEPKDNHELSAVKALERIRQEHDGEELQSLQRHLSTEIQNAYQVLGTLLQVLTNLDDDSTFDQNDVARLKEIIEDEHDLEEMAEKISYEVSDEAQRNMSEYKSQTEYEVLKFINRDITKLENRFEIIERELTEMVQEYNRLQNL
jgi:hypothetical protein